MYPERERERVRERERERERCKGGEKGGYLVFDICMFERMQETVNLIFFI